jgi:hypothetical protein
MLALLHPQQQELRLCMQLRLQAMVQQHQLQLHKQHHQQLVHLEGKNIGFLITRVYRNEFTVDWQRVHALFTPCIAFYSLHASAQCSKNLCVPCVV